MTKRMKLAMVSMAAVAAMGLGAVTPAEPEGTISAGRDAWCC
ncbi:hypothetical protein [Nocardioides panacisoli]|nr:hypothetical protein [Nocardioides panacisoli]